MAAEERVQKLREALQFCIDNLDCAHVHHRKSEYHDDGPCPVMARLERVMVETL